MEYIKYIDKEKSLNLNSTLIVTADDANEIKLVVNNIIDWLKEEGPSIKNIFKYIKFNVASLQQNINYDIVVETSTSKNFENDTVSKIILSENPSKFKMFNNGTFYEIDRLINGTDNGRQILVDVSDIIDEDKIYCRYYYVSNTNNSKKTFIIGANDYQRMSSEIPVPVILINEENSALLSSLVENSKSYAKNRFNDMKEIEEIEDVHVFHSYLKYDSIPDEIRSYCVSKNMQIIGNSVIDVTDYTDFSFTNNTSKSEKYQKLITGTATLDETIFDFERTVLANTKKDGIHSLKNPQLSRKCLRICS